MNPRNEEINVYVWKHKTTIFSFHYTGFTLKNCLTLKKQEMSESKKRNLKTVVQVADELNVHPHTVRRAYHRGEIKNYGIGKILKFDINEVLGVTT